MRDEGHGPLGALKKRASEALGGSDSRFRAIFEDTPVPIVVTDARGQFVRWNQAFLDLLGYTEEQLAGLTLARITQSSDVKAEEPLLRELMAGKTSSYQVVRRCTRADGRALTLHASCFALMGSRNARLLVTMLHDATEGHQAESALRLVRNRLALQYAVTEVLDSTSTLEEALPHLLPAICQTGGWDATAFWLVDRRGEVMRCQAVWSDPSSGTALGTISREITVQPGEGLPGRAWAGNELLWCPDIDRESNFFLDLKAAREGLQSALCTPVRVGTEVRGVLELFSVGQRRMDGESLRSAEAAGMQLGRLCERALSEDMLSNGEQRYRSLTEMAHDAVIEMDDRGVIVNVNDATSDVFGYTRDELVGQPLTILMPANLRGAHTGGLQRYLATGDRRLRWAGLQLPGIHRDGRSLMLEISLAEFREGGRRTFTGVVRDVTHHKDEESARFHQTLHDSLTDLPNRGLLLERLQQAVLVGRRHATPLALMVLDLDRFKEVNDSFGHSGGDLLLQQVANRLRPLVRESDTFARLGGDEFALLLPVTEESGATLVAQRVMEAFKAPFSLAGQSVEVGGSLGIALYPDHGEDDAALLQRADSAMYSAKRTGSGYKLYSVEKDESSTDRLVLTAELRQGIENGDLRLYYQPKVKLEDGRTEGVEALVRWQHAERGFVPPDAFIGLAEETGLIKPLTVWVMNQALRQHKEWQRLGFNIRMSVNVSARMLHDPQLVATVNELLQRWDVEPSYLELEITEGSLMVDPEGAMETLRQLRTAGVWSSIDDFGMGYSSLGYLKRLPVDELKIDKSFVMDMASSRDDASIVRSVVTLGHNLGLHVVAEGVDNKRTLDMLCAMGCDMAQGYYLSRPVAADALTQWLGQPPQRLVNTA